MNKLTLRTFTITLHGRKTGEVYFVGEEYDIRTVKKFLIDVDGMSRDIEVKLVREVTK